MEYKEEEYVYRFAIDKMTEAKAEELFDVIMCWVEENGFYLGGGCCTWEQWAKAHVEGGNG